MTEIHVLIMNKWDVTGLNARPCTATNWADLTRLY